MRFSRVAGLVFILATVLIGTSCGYYNRVMARKDLVDGSKAYKDRKFPEAEKLFRQATGRDPQGSNVEGRMAQLFLARTLHSMYIGDRQNKPLAEKAIAEYQKALAVDNKDQSSYKAIASLYENLQMTDQWLAWVTKRSNDASIPPEQRAEALVSLAAKKNTCANDISDTEATKKTITKDGKQVFQFVKPAAPEDLTTLAQCVEEGTRLVDQAVALETDQVKNAPRIDVKGLSDTDLVKTQDMLKVFESVRSYKASLLVQSMRLAEMNGNTADRDRFKAEADAARQSFVSLSDVVKKLQAEVDARTAAKEGDAANAEKK
jgi:tetratricopeptide (TPR) repeat protein